MNLYEEIEKIKTQGYSEGIQFPMIPSDVLLKN